ncbi:hypothetical protein XI03_07710 [Bradyrhizobium sp. CCBAU 65884]|uniref:hypothetical protein n=1 Tax=Bradyrhizobium sp. CCBAU 65884 TaxID=722477 RepID=UPI002306D65A|nr:hypothetical protein [Bradyrhizobium sp. CCBAU 65884]MDA9474392.1 hypothetical protein [Bradyrhizobium sp. CCBAU 65884]
MKLYPLRTNASTRLISPAVDFGHGYAHSSPITLVHYFDKFCFSNQKYGLANPGTVTTYSGAVHQEEVAGRSIFSKKSDT